jgi:hypothetical protein
LEIYNSPPLSKLVATELSTIKREVGYEYAVLGSWRTGVKRYAKDIRDISRRKANVL